MADISKIQLPDGNKYDVKDTTKQPLLVSGTNIKTINNESLLGSGNIAIQGGSDQVFIANYGSTTGSELLNAINANKIIFAKKTDSSGTRILPMVGASGDAVDVLYVVFCGVDGASLITYEFIFEDWEYEECTINSTPNARAVAKFDTTAHMNSTDMTAAEVTSFINSLTPTASKAVDYIVEQGTSGIWTYRKWQSGIAECWGRTDVPSYAYPAAGATSVEETLPINLFIEEPVINTSGGIAGTLNSDTRYTNAYGNNRFGTYLVNVNATTPVTATGWVYWQVRGRWK